MYFDPMLHEFSFASSVVVRPLSFSPEGSGREISSPEYRPTSSLWTPPLQKAPERDARGVASPPESPHYMPSGGPQPVKGAAHSEEILFGPGIQLDDIAAQLTRMDIDAPGAEQGQPPQELPQHEGDGNSFLERAFGAPRQAELMPPARSLRREVSQAREPSTRLKAKAQRASNRLAARPSPILVSKRAQHHLTKELSFINKEEAVSEDVVAAYIDTYKTSLPGKAVATLRSATKLGNKAAASALASLAEEEAAAELEAI
ncbi:hypothetical protein C2845_PM01G26810 [Panicum miliaceum]|uniref:Uncharacterized protein n=1 Tax=Panicum miliaceum TaxID=4540 RepID=A0A3L6TTP7_PANMI|nr:hypothetical protein C2845_PM01G26810 [Panicum miliaceum]